jgi:hypothetical protein
MDKEKKESMFPMLLDSIIEWCFNRNRNRRPRPTKPEIADVIDAYLVDSNRYEDGAIIRIKANGYNYYITRSVDTRNTYR